MRCPEREYGTELLRGQEVKERKGKGELPPFPFLT